MEKLKEYMTKHNLTQKELAERVGLHQGTVSKHLQGKGMTLETALRYYRKLGIPIDQLIVEQGNKSQED